MIFTIPYIAELSESIQRVYRDFDIKTALSQVRHNKVTHLIKVKDILYLLVPVIPIVWPAAVVNYIQFSHSRLK